MFDGSIAIVKPISFGSLDAFKEQDDLYTVLLRGKENGKIVSDRRIITSVSKTLDCQEDYDDYMALAKLDILRFVVSNTTEAGIVLGKNVIVVMADNLKTFTENLCHSCSIKVSINIVLMLFL